MYPNLTPSTPQLKQCTKCKEWLPATADYFHSGTGIYGFRSPCRKCRSTRPGGWIAPTQEGYLRCHACLNEFPATTKFFALSKTAKTGFQPACKKCQREWRSTNRDKLHQDYRQRYDNNPEKWLEYSKTYRKKNPGKQASDARKRYAANLEKSREYSRKQYAANPQARIRSSRKFAMANPEKARLIMNRREARRRSLPATLTNQQWEDALAYWHGCCAYCGNQPGLFRNTILTMDHFVPLLSPDCPGTVSTNIVPACYGCNSSKNHHSVAAWLTSRFGSKKATVILARVETYFVSIRDG